MIEEIVKELSSPDEEGFKNSIYDDSSGKIVPKGTPIDQEGKLPSGGNPTIGTGHLVTPEEYDTIYKTGEMYSKSELDKLLYEDVQEKMNIVNETIEKKYDNKPVADDVKKILVKTTFWLDAPNKFPKFFEGMVTGDYQKAIDNLIYTNPEVSKEQYTKIYEPEKGMSGLKERTLKYIEAINKLKNNNLPRPKIEIEFPNKEKSLKNELAKRRAGVTELY
jgi:GH24 family phage-related lysozyme (muramidase)